MELRGDEKRIQALFSELSLDDQSRAPVFEKLWNRAEATRSAKAGRFHGRVAVIVIAMLIAVAFSFGLWSHSKPSQSRSQETVQVASQEIQEPPASNTQESVQPVSVRRPRRTRQKTLARHRQTERALTHEAAMLSSWQSPTQIFMQTSAGFVLKSLPQLNQSAKELELFLPKHIETTKESNQ